ncbi:unnamed protein product [Arabis nemorensis]|uniref:Uncharacterized protein n=1 Tax=Arabis nemorensis TaxID=586526 RepID=A0A565CP84_9BRAS|nr:unnamed protein product [Arabis nemorensis]
MSPLRLFILHNLHPKISRKSALVPTSSIGRLFSRRSFVASDTCHGRASHYGRVDNGARPSGLLGHTPPCSCAAREDYHGGRCDVLGQGSD